MVTSSESEILDRVKNHVECHAWVYDRWPYPIRIKVEIYGVVFSDTSMARLTEKVFANITNKAT